MGVRVRKLEGLDKGTIQAIIDLETETFGAGGLDEWTLPILVEYGKVFVLERGRKILGAAVLLRDWSEEHLAYLVSLSVVKDARGQGWGSKFLSRVIEHLAAEGFAQILLTVSPENPVAHSLYEKCGFRKVSFLKNYYGPGEDRLLMELRLESERND